LIQVNLTSAEDIAQQNSEEELRMKRAGVALAFMICGLVAVHASRGEGRGFQGQLAGSQPGEHVAGVPSGGAPWTISNSEFNLSNDGRLQMEARGLLISSGSAANTVGPVTMVTASLVCGDLITASTSAVPLNSAGDFAIHDTITVPTQCIAPAILIRIAETVSGPVTNGAFIAVNAIKAGTAGGNGQNRNH
jgi:hypothetical protein